MKFKDKKTLNVKKNRISRKERNKNKFCPCCKNESSFMWRCNCGFEFCQLCMDDNTWGVTCNSITWTCPDCGELRSY